MLHLALAAALAASGPIPIRAVAPADVRVMRAVNPHVRYVRLRLSIVQAGVTGTETSVYDLATGRWLDSVAAGPLSGSDGFDGHRSWSNDATGMPLIEGNAASRLDTLATAHFYGRRGPEQPHVSELPARLGAFRLRLRYPPLTGPIDVTIDRATGRVRSYEDDTDLEPAVTHFSDYRHVAGVVLPFRVDTVNRYGAVHERVRAVEILNAVASDTFSPPPPPDDVRLVGISTLAMSGYGAPIVPIRINGGPVLHVLFDTGASNFVKPAVARRLGLTVVGHGRAGGVGAGLVSQRYTTVRRLQIGSAVLRDQPFSVIDDDTFGAEVDGSIGCEVMQRFTVRFDFWLRRVALTRQPNGFRIGTPAIPMHLSGCMPEIDGALDGIHGPIGIDTGSEATLNVMSPTVRKHRLIERYRASRQVRSGRGIGGATFGYVVRSRSLQLGPHVLHGLPVLLDTMGAGAFNDPTELGIAGTRSLWTFVTVFDYRSSRMWLLR